MKQILFSKILKQSSLEITNNSAKKVIKGINRQN